MYKFIFFFFISYNCFSANLVLQDSVAAVEQTIIYDETERQPLEFDNEFIEELKEQEDFNYVGEAPPENWWTQFKTWLSKKWNSILEAIFGNLEAGSILSFILELLPYLILAGVFALIIYLFIRLDPGGAFMKKAPQPDVFLSEDEKIIQSQDINKLIENALADKNYRLAIRYYYLLILKNLSEREIIAYEVDKTNADYLKEIKNLSWQEQFKLLTRIYDFIWYGNFAISQNDFFKAEKQFKNMQSQLQQVNNE